MGAGREWKGCKASGISLVRSLSGNHKAKAGAERIPISCSRVRSLAFRRNGAKPEPAEAGTTNETRGGHPGLQESEMRVRSRNPDIHEN